MNYSEVLELAKKNIGPNCKVCPDCNGLGCGNKLPGPGSKGPGNGANDNRTAWQKIRLEMDTIYPGVPADTSFELFGKTFSMPLITAPVGALSFQFNEGDDIRQFNDSVFKAVAETGVIGSFGDGMGGDTLSSGLEALKKHGAAVIPILNPIPDSYIMRNIGLIKQYDCLAAGIVVDSAGLPHFKNAGSGAGAKSVEQLKAIREAIPEMPFVIKGVLNARAAEKAVKAGADAVIVSNHGGRTLPYAPATADVLPEIVNAVGGQAKIIVDGGIRTGADIFKALAIGADAVMICRPVIISWYGAGAEGVKLYIEKLKAELEDTMYMCGTSKLSEISSDRVRYVR